MIKKPVVVVVAVGVVAAQVGAHDFQELGVLIDLPLASVTLTTSVDAYQGAIIHPITDELIRLPLPHLSNETAAKSS
jgi:hypothetical protein